MIFCSDPLSFFEHFELALGCGVKCDLVDADESESPEVVQSAQFNLEYGVVEQVLPGWLQFVI